MQPQMEQTAFDNKMLLYSQLSGQPQQQTPPYNLPSAQNTGFIPPADK